MRHRHEPGSGQVGGEQARQRQQGRQQRRDPPFGLLIPPTAVRAVLGLPWRLAPTGTSTSPLMASARATSPDRVSRRWRFDSGGFPDARCDRLRRDLARFDVGLVEGVDLQDRSRDGRGDRPLGHLGIASFERRGECLEGALDECLGIASQLLAGVGLVVLSPLLLLVAILIKLDSPGPVFFLQRRYGFNQKSFRILKFRTNEEVRRGNGPQKTEGAIRSGTTPSCSQQNILPLRPMPLWTSSNTSKAPYLSQISRAAAR